jgi:hypothetical protein
MDGHDLTVAHSSKLVIYLGSLVGTEAQTAHNQDSSCPIAPSRIPPS